MKRPAFLLTLVSLMLSAIFPLHTFASPDEDNTPADKQTQPNDSTGLIKSPSKGGESFFNGIIPPSPQASALARYAEYPVSHTTGIPEITVPLYEIELGDFTLPISISYHASGARPDEIPTSVGLGWVLNAGGAISRTVLGKPDMFYYSASETDYTYFSENNVRDMLDEIIKTGDNTLTSKLGNIISENYEVDTESDRYTFNIAGRHGIFRYSYSDRQFVILNNSNDQINASGKSSNGGGITFRLYTTDGIDFIFSQEERTGAIQDYLENPFTSAWYVSSIITPWGQIDFTYESAPPLNRNMFSVCATAGRRYEFTSSLKMPDDYYEMRAFENQYTISYDQKILKKIEWNGNRVEFTYSPGEMNATLHRLTEMKVYDANGNQRKSITFDNTDYWPTGNSRTGRRLLKSVSDSENGIWNFTYNKSISLPELPLGHSPACESDWWGFWNASSSPTSLSVLTQAQKDWLANGYNDYSGFSSPYPRDELPQARDRSPSLAHTKAGVLTSVTYPTGACVTFDYELNKFGTRNYGGLRIKSQTISNIGDNLDQVKTYSYESSYLTQEDPEELCKYISYIQLTLDNTLGNPHPYSYRSISEFPITPVVCSSNPVVYDMVLETRGDGSSIRYLYDANELQELFGIDAQLTHPSLYAQSVRDYGIREPLLLSKTVYDGNTEVYKETYTYSRSERKRFETGVRTSLCYYETNFPPDQYTPITVSPSNVARFGMLKYCKSYAYSRAAVMTSKTVSYPSTGFSTSTQYSYDQSFRTFLPRTESVTNSDGTVITKRYTFPFDMPSNTVCADMTEMGYTDFPVKITTVIPGSTSAQDRTLAVTETDYGYFNEKYYPLASYSWQRPTTDLSVSVPASLPERERVTSYNSLGRPLSIKVNETDETSFTWNSTGNLLVKSTAPGGLATTYSHRPLFGVSLITEPNGHPTSFTYNSLGRLAQVNDNYGVIESYEYSISGHSDSGYKANGNSLTAKRRLSANPNLYTTSRQYFDGLGRPSVFAFNGAGTSGKYIYSAVTYDNAGREKRNIMPAVGNGTLESKTALQVAAMLSATYGDSYAFSETAYDAFDRPVKIQTPGQAWHTADKAKTTAYIANAANSVKRYTAPVTSLSLSDNGYYAASDLLGERSIDEDNREITVYFDRLGRKVLERRGPESSKGQNDTYFVYNALGQLRFVLSPGYQQSASTDKFAYEYRYDASGNVVRKSIPGGGYTEYWYDRAGRMSFMQDPNLRARNLHRFFLYDKAGRLAIQGVSASCTRSASVNFATYSGGTGGFQSTGYTLGDQSLIQQVTLERVNYFDTYSFAGSLDSRLVVSSPESALGLTTGTVAYNSDGGRSLAAMYYDKRGNVTTLKEVTDFGTLRTTTNTYTFTRQLLTSSVTESGGVAMLTENSYHSGTGLLTATDVTVNSTKQRVAGLTYDDLGRVKSIARGNSGGTVSYGYNLHGQTVSISGPGFSQSLHYADGPGTKCYNGSVSAMTWNMGNDATTRGYKYTYNAYNWLTNAEYGEGSSISSNKNRYSEKLTGFMRNGGVTALQRHGLRPDGTYGTVDNLSVTYDGNRVQSVSDAAPAITQPGSMDYPGGSSGNVFSYNSWGALEKDAGRGITSVTYDNLGNPQQISYSDQSYTRHVYSSSGDKLKSVHHSTPSLLSLAAMDGTATKAVSAAAGQETFEYRGQVIYRNGAVHMVLFPGGYATISGSTVTFHFYTQDYLGNNRAVVNGSTGTIEQTTAYYPYGGVIADLGSGNSGQPFKFGGKELVTANGLNEYDFGARRYYQAIPHFTSIDPLCEKFYWLSPYLYCANNPVNLVDRDGNFFETLWDIGNVLYDVGAAIANHIQGDHATAVSLWTDAAFDTAAAFIPLVPAGASKISKAAKAINKASDTKSAGKGLMNANAIKEGKEYEKHIVKKLKKQGVDVTDQITLVPVDKAGNRIGKSTRGDALITNKDGSKTLIETKRSESTRLTTSQKKARNHITNGNKQFEVRSNKDEYKKGQIIRIEHWERIDKYKNQ